MKKVFIIAVVLICASFSIVFFAALNSSPKSLMQDEIDITACITTAEELDMEIGQVPETMLETSASVDRKTAVNDSADSAKLEQIKSSQKNEIAQVYSGQIADKVYRQFAENLDALVSTPGIQGLSEENQFVDMKIDSGVLNLEVSNVNLNSEQGTADSDFVAWDIRIVSEYKNYAVYMTMSKMNQSYNLSKENGVWLITDVSGYEQVFAPDDYEYRKGVFSTVEEAIDFAKTLEPERENPF